MDNLKLHSNILYTSREDKPRYVCDKYMPVLKGKILDIGADQCGLKIFLPADTEYIGVDLNDSADVRIDLENEILPFEDDSFDCVLCLDVLEHLDNLYDVFDSLCRISKQYLIISLPNPWSDFITMLRRGYYRHGDKPIKYYNLPVNPPQDRHKWFYGIHEAERFLRERGQMNSMRTIDIDRIELGSKVKRKLFQLAAKIMCHKDVDVQSLTINSIWVLLEKR